MSLKLHLGAEGDVDLSSAGDIFKHLVPGKDNFIRFAPGELLSSKVADLPSKPIGFDFDDSPSWTIAPITITVKPGAACGVTVLKAGDKLYECASGPDGEPVSQKAPAGRCYLNITMTVSLSVSAGAQFSSGNFGVSGSVSGNDQVRLTFCHQVLGTTTLRDALAAAFSNLVLPFHAASIQGMGDGDCLDFEFDGKLALGFGVSYGFSSLLLGGNSSGDVIASFATPIGKGIITSAPCVQVSAQFKVTYSHEDSFRVIVVRTNAAETNAVRLHVLRKHADTVSTSESAGLTLNPGVKFQMGSAQLQSELGQVAQQCKGKPLIYGLANKAAANADALSADINSGVNALLAQGNGQKMQLELLQTRASSDTALFIYNMDLTQGNAGYDLAMRGDYAGAITQAGVTLDPASFVEQAYLASAGIKVQLFNLLQYSDVTQYLDKTDVAYVGPRTLQIRTTEQIQEISGLLKHQQEADLSFVAEYRKTDDAETLSGVDVRWQAIFADHANAGAFQHTVNLLSALGQSAAAAAVQDWRQKTNASKSLKLTINAPAAMFAGIQADELQNGKPPAEPHTHDQANYEKFVAAFGKVAGASDAAGGTFVRAFGKYGDWLAFNRIKNDGPNSAKPGNRLILGDQAISNWPENYPPSDLAVRAMVQAHVYAAQSFMNLCDSLHHLAIDAAGVASAKQYAAMIEAIRGMIRSEAPFPAYFLKPAIATLLSLAGNAISMATPSSTGSGGGDFAIELKVQAAGMASLP